MAKKLIINVTEPETRVALLEDGTISELFIERRDNSDITGNVYKGRVQRVLPGMQAAFVDIGISQAAFIYVDDVLGDKDFEEIENMFAERAGAEDPVLPLSDEGYRTSRSEHPIEELIAEGQEILVQASKSPIGTKGARLTSHLSLPGRFLVLMPTTSHVGVSRRIENEAERSRLKTLLQGLRKENLGYIVRTAAEGVPEEKLANEMAFMNNLWENIKRKHRAASAPALLHQELSVCLRAVRDLLTNEVEKMVVDSRPEYESVLSFLDGFIPRPKDAVELYEGTEPIFDVYNLEGDISRALKKKVWLKSGGYIVIEQTEALAAIDVNTGRYVGKYNLEETILKTNLEAVKEIAYQIRLRDIGGIIIIDFIDMENKANQEKVFNALNDALKKDRSKTHVLPMSEIGLIQMTRKRTRKPFTRMHLEPCFYCEGEGLLISRQAICYKIYRKILTSPDHVSGIALTLRVNPEIAELMLGHENHIIASLEKRIGRKVLIYPDARLHMEEFEILENLKD